MDAPRYGWFGDDFTGATDTLATINERGHRAFLFLGVPDAAHLSAAGPLDAVGIASATRSMGSSELRTAVEPAGNFFRALGVRLVHYKCCSTFDSAPEVGNLAVAIETLRPFVDHPTAVILGGQPSLGRYCVFSNLFAAAGDETHRLDRHPTMSRHPATPMGEADLRRHLATLGLESVEGIHYRSLDDGARLLDRLASSEDEAVLLDALTQEHVSMAGAALRRMAENGSVLAVGASGVAEAFFAARQAPTVAATNNLEVSQVLAIAGSLSPTTREQVLASRRYRRLRIDPVTLIASSAYRDDVLADATKILRIGDNLLLHTMSLDGLTPDAADISLALEGARLVSAILDQYPVRRLIAAGGDTSSHLVQTLGIWGIGFAGRADKGVAVSRARSDRTDRDGMLLILKGGQMGEPDLLDRFAGSVDVEHLS
ncbi:four-carbon acid sugar kinase family protein [Aureimonas ureilytica]|uniref:four-carbon acid sugar kinase family protein n=1 Tax=Aureimonas ureilytica TaxID=401562 RepID=UPI000370F6BD|nr:four-carbon acid sugar kinase family protein [Aureimonas ureilytica]